MGEQFGQIWDETKMIYYRPNVRGATMKFDHEMTLWEEILKRVEGVEERKSGFDLFDFSLTFPLLPCMPQSVLARYFEIFFEHFNFEAVLPYHSSTLLYEKARKDYGSRLMQPGFELNNRYGLMVESSESGTYFSPFIEGELQMPGVCK
jgi:actin-related protein